MVAKRIIRILLLTCFAGYVSIVEYQRNGIQLLFTVMMLGITFWAGCCLWEDPDETEGALPRDAREPVGRVGGDSDGNGG